MADAILVLCLLLCAGLLFARRARRTIQHDWLAIYRRSRMAAVCYGLLVVLMVFGALRRSYPSALKNWMPVILLTLGLGIFLFQFFHARRKMREQPDFKTPTKKPLPLFFWQAILILLPVALMAGFGFWALLHQRRAVEQDAQQRAQDILHALPDEFGRLAANQLTRSDWMKSAWFQYLQGAIAPWPDDKNRKEWQADTNESQIISNSLVTLHSAFPEWRDGPPPLVDFSFDTNGDLAFNALGSIPPRPPAWLATMSVEQQQAWAALQTTSGTVESMSNSVNAFRQTRPPAAALACAEFLQLRAGLSALTPTNGLAKVLRFAGRHSNDISESGIPLRTLALAMALQLAGGCGPDENLWRQLLSEISSPTMLTPLLLDEAGRLVSGNPQLTESVNAMRILLADKLAQSEMAVAVRQTGKLNGITTTNLWLDAMGRRWFCILSPSESQLHTSISNRPVTIVSPLTQVQCYPQSWVANALAGALGDAKVSLPGYFGISFNLEGVPLPLLEPGAARPPSDILAEGAFEMSERAGMHKRDPETGQGRDVFFEAIPSHPKFTLQIRLVDRHLLYARQSQLQLIFGSLITLSALSALIGFIAAYRSYCREQRLNDLKTNFVSSVSHELRAPIASVRLMAENLERGKIPDPARQGEYFRFIVQECRRLSSLIENVLDFSRIEQGRKQYEVEPTNLLALAETTVKLMEPYAAEKGVILKLATFNLQSSTSNLELNVDGRALQQALVNLIDNAVKHSPKGEMVTVEINNAVGADTLNLSVADHGPGIPAAEREKIFERFYRLGSELRRETQGVGIGLSVVKHIVEAHGGRVVVESEIGRGSRFTIELPMKNAKTINGRQ